MTLASARTSLSVLPARTVSVHASSLKSLSVATAEDFPKSSLVLFFDALHIFSTFLVFSLVLALFYAITIICTQSISL